MVSLARVLPIESVRAGERIARSDAVAVEEPLEMRLAAHGDSGPGRALAITMRSPGHDEELAVGFLHGEGIIQDAGDIQQVGHCGTGGNVVRVSLRKGLAVETSRLERNFYTSSSCGLFGKASIEAAMSAIRPVRVPLGALEVSSELLLKLPAKMRAAQSTFDATGGLHASALFDSAGELRLLREDVGRHNALDKVIGAALRAGWLPLADTMLVLSGRASFELLQKAMAAQIPLVAAVGAPSTLAIELAESAGITLVGFLRDGGFNVYTHAGRVRLSRATAESRSARASNLGTA